MSNYLKSTALVSFCTLLSRILGLLRDISLAAMFGAGVVLDAFLLAFTLPNLFRRFFGEGALSSVFIPIFTRTMEKDGKDAANELTNKVITLLAIFLIIVVVVISVACFLFSWWPGILPKNKLALGLAAVMTPYLLLICLTAILGSLLNAVRHFLAPALAPVLLNIVWLLAIFILYFYFKDDSTSYAYGMAIAILIGGIVQVVVQLFAVKKNGFDLRPNFDRESPELQEMIKNFGPVVFGAAVFQINVLMDRLIAWWMIPHAGSLTVLYMGNRLIQFPLALIGISLATAVFPIFSRHAARAEYDSLSKKIPQAINIAMFFSLPASAGLIILAAPIVALFYQHDQFSALAASRTALVVIAYAVGLWLYTSLQITIKVFHSMGDTKTPVKVSTWCVLGNLALNLILVQFFYEMGLALATSINALINLLVLNHILQKKIKLDQNDHYFLLKVMSSVVAMSAVVLITLYLCRDYGRIVKVFFPIATGVIMYFACSYALRISELKFILSSIKK